MVLNPPDQPMQLAVDVAEYRVDQHAPPGDGREDVSSGGT